MDDANDEGYSGMTLMQQTPEDLAQEVRRLIDLLRSTGRTDLLLKAVSVPVLEELCMEAAKGRLSRLLITKSYQFILLDHERQLVDLQPVHKAVYLLFLAHPEGIEFKCLSDHRDELRMWYRKVAPGLSPEKMEESINHLVNPLDNAINEKCSRIKRVFSDLLDEYTACYYIISGHAQKHVASSNRIWFERRKIILLPRDLVVWE